MARTRTGDMERSEILIIKAHNSSAHKGTMDASWTESGQPTRKVHPRIKSKPSTAIAAKGEGDGARRSREDPGGGPD